MSQPAAPSRAYLLRRAFLRALLGTIAAIAFLYGLDYVILRLRAAMNWNAYGSVTVSHYYAVLQKNGKTQFTFDPPQSQACANSLFPHQALYPCWYLRRHPEQRTDI